MHSTSASRREAGSPLSHSVNQMVKRGLTAVGLYATLMAAWLIVRPGGHHGVVVADNLCQFVGPIIMFGTYVWYDFRHMCVHGRARLSSYLLVGGVLTDSIGQIIWSFYELVLHQQTPFPSLADAAYLCTYPLLLGGVLLIPGCRISLLFRTRVALDGMIVMAGVVTFSWYFVLGPTMLQGGETAFAKAVGTAYPLADVLLIACLLILAPGVRDASMRPVLSLLSAGLLCVIGADTVFDYGTLHNTYATGNLIDVAWPVGDMLLGLAALLMTAHPRAHELSGEAIDDRHLPKSRSTWISLVPYAIVPPVGALLLYISHVQHDTNLEPGVIAGSAGLIALVLIRQVLAILDNARLTGALAARNDALLEVNRRLEALATSDPLTGLPNHRSLIASLDFELERSHRYRRPCSVIFVDLDHFKALNDGFGHAAGDTALTELGHVIQRQLRSIDIVGRWGGEEFLVILPETAYEEAMSIAERIRFGVASHRFTVGMGIRLTCSLGVASNPSDADTRDELVSLADRAMYAAKYLGRNQARYAGDSAATALDGAALAHGSREETALRGTVEALAALVDARDQYTGRHAQDVARLSMQIGLAMGLSANEVHLIGLAGRLHDVGKVAIPDAVLLKQGSLSQEEWALIHLHPIVGAHVASRVPGLSAIAPIIRAHHERWDGSGYPDRQRGEEIHVGARIVSVADAFNAMLTDRPYRQHCSVDEALTELRRCAESQWDPKVIAALERALSTTSESADHRKVG